MATAFDPRFDHNGAMRTRRPLRIPPPPGRREKVVVEALKTLAEKREDFIKSVEDVIDDHGITIEVARLRDRLTKLAVGDTERLLLSTAGVTEKLFYEAIEDELKESDTDRLEELFGKFLRRGNAGSKPGAGGASGARSRGGGPVATATKQPPPKAGASSAQANGPGAGRRGGRAPNGSATSGPTATKRRASSAGPSPAQAGARVPESTKAENKKVSKGATKGTKR